jgi:hypothetical protein
LLANHWICQIVESLQYILHLSYHNLKYFALIDDSVQGVPHFMRNGRVDQSEKLSFSF